MYEHLLHPRSAQVTREAGFMRRFAGFIFDVLVLDVFVTAPFTPVFADAVSRMDGNPLAASFTGAEMVGVALLFMIVYAYFVLFEYVLGQTPGMMLVGTRTDGRLWQHLVRNSMFVPVFPFMLFCIIEPFAILFSGRGVLERLSGTRTTHPQEVLF